MIANLIRTDGIYNFWQLTDGEIILWNITPVDTPEPIGGYENKSYIEKIKHVRFEEKEIDKATNT